jgi:polyisoprenoid-binding protein YceI
MRFRLFGLVAAAIVASSFVTASVRADDYAIDPIHSSVTFKIKHLGVSYVFGRFDKFSGSFTIDPSDASKCSFNMSITTDSVDTNNTGRDNHLRSPDMFNAKQFPTMTFKSTSVKAAGEGYEVTGDLTMKDVTKSITFTLEGGKTAQMRGKKLTGFWTDLIVKRSDFNVGGAQMANALGEDVHVAIAFEGGSK